MSRNPEMSNLSDTVENGDGELEHSVNGDKGCPGTAAGLCRPVSPDDVPSLSVGRSGTTTSLPSDPTTNSHWHQRARRNREGSVESDHVENGGDTIEICAASADHNGHLSSWPGEMSNDHANIRSIHIVTAPDADGDEGHDDVTQLTSQRAPPSRRPGVILLGRGNSFSLGRSEVILLHGRHKRRGNGEPPDPFTTTTTPPLVTHNGDCGLDTLPSSSPQVLSTGDDDNDVCDLQDSKRDEELEQLWRRAEAVMMAKRGTVLKVMEDFGIGQRDTQLPRDEEEEEEVWRVIQDQADLSR